MRNFSLFILLIVSFLSIPAFADDFSIASEAAADKSALPTLYSCDGADTSPQLSWTNIPAQTKSFALILSDPDAPHGTFYHWVVFNIPATVHQLAEGISQYPASSQLGKNSWGKSQYNGPCPPPGSIHHYIFTLYALDTLLTLSAEADVSSVMSAMQSHILKQAQFTVSYSRWPKT